MKIRTQVLIDKNVEEVFQFLVADFSTNYPKVDKGVFEVWQEPRDSIQIGTTFTVVNATTSTQTIDFSNNSGRVSVKIEEQKPNLKGMKRTEIYSVTDYELNKRFIIEAITPKYRVIHGFNFIATDHKTLITYDFIINTSNLLWIILTSIFKFAAKAACKEQLNNLKQAMSN